MESRDLLESIHFSFLKNVMFATVWEKVKKCSPNVFLKLKKQTFSLSHTLFYFLS